MTIGPDVGKAKNDRQQPESDLEPPEGAVSGFSY
jgi:hypothetical protein